MTSEHGPPGTSTIFDVIDVHYAYHDTPALTGLSLRIERGERIVLLGANGSGKSTLLRLLDGLYFPSRGRIEAFAQALDEEHFHHDETAFAFRRRVGFVFQNSDVQLFNPTVFDEIAFGPLQLGWPKSQIRTRVAAILDEFSIDHLKDRPPHRLSGGEKKRVALASVLAIDPEVLLLDEPTAALDPKSASALIDFLVTCRGSGRTVITATHDLDIVEDIADRCIVMEAGRVIASGTPHEILMDVPLLTRAGLSHVHLHLHGATAAHSHHHLHHDHHASAGGHHD
ncbi:MAG: ABC transporter ATP-binding protein [Pseudolabrys sp.]|jgi:cobalt/nickel transport system ATP-binding protein